MTITPGEYRTRDGRKAVVEEVYDTLRRGSSAPDPYPVIGSIDSQLFWWSKSGRVDHGYTTDCDLVAQWSEPATISKAEEALDRAFERFVP